MYTLIHFRQRPPLLIPFISLLLLLFTTQHGLLAQTDCPTPVLNPVAYECDGAVQLSWPAVPGALQYTVEVENSAGMDVVDFINMPDTSFTISAGTLEAGQDYTYSLTADCGNSTVSAVQGSIDGSAIQQLLPEIVIVDSEGTSCPDAADGSLSATVEAHGCNSVFGLVLAGDTTAISEGDTLVYNNLDTGSYSLQLVLDQAVDCNYTSACLDSVFTEVQLQSTDSDPPSLAALNAVGTTPDSLTTFTLPEGNCGIQRTWVIHTFDNCGVPDVEVDVATTSNNLTVFPGGNAVVSYNGTSFILELFAATGTNTVTITSTDADGNTASQTFVVEVRDVRAPVIQGPGDIMVETPSCDSDTPVNWTVSTQDDCDLEPDLQQIAGPPSGSNLSVGQYTVTYEATDDYGNSSTYSFDITIQQGDSPAPIVDLSGNTQFNLSPCEAEAFVLLSGNIMDCTITPGSNVAGDISVSGAPLSLGAISVQAGYAYFELTGSLPPGFYSVELAYQGLVFQTTAVIVEQEPDQPADLNLPGNLTFTIPECTDSLNTYIGIGFQDDCDQAPNMDNLSVNLDGQPLPLIEEQSGPNALTYELLLTADLDSAELEVLYIDAAGNISEAANTLSVVSQADEEAPVLVYPAQHIYKQLDACAQPLQEVCFEAQATDNCDAAVDVNLFVSNESGDLFPLNNPSGNTYCTILPPGNYTVSLQAEDEAGNSSTGSFNIHLTQESSSEVNLSCNDQINISLDENCSRRITPDMLLEGTFGCLDDSDFLIGIDDLKPQNDSILDGHGLFEYEIDLRPGVDAGPGFEPCWGHIRSMDNRDPELIVPADTEVGQV
ncbi:MAG: HYR domain-containing protein, partial [Bacteroidetes bacterium]|nr:HYR domain-containing protein [Bacteroidota bacterium]